MWCSRNHFLQAKTEPQAQGAAKESEDSEIEAHEVQDRDNRHGIEKNAVETRFGVNLPRRRTFLSSENRFI
jgi:hypothetical protein